MKTIKQYNQPGEYEEQVRAEEWVGVMRAEEEEEYKLSVVVEVGENMVSPVQNRVVVRAIARNGAKVSLSGMIKIPKGVRGIDSQLELRVLLLDDESSGIVNPELEIESDEVRAGHSASVSKINEEQVQYLMSRGINREQAEEEIVEGWLMVE